MIPPSHLHQAQAAMPSARVGQRASAGYDPLEELSAPLLVPPSARKYNMQYSSLYDYRLRRLKHPKGRLLAKATRQWRELAASQTSSSSGGLGSSLPRAEYTKRILDIRQGQICFVIGTIYCSMHLKPDVLEELTREQYLPPQPPSAMYADPESDEFFIEDESGRVRLVGDALAPDGELRGALVTGVVCAVLGTETRAGDFEVADVVFAGLPEKNAGSSTLRKKSDTDDAMDVDGAKGQWTAIVSGLDIESSSASLSAGAESANGSGRPNGDIKSESSGQGATMLGSSTTRLRLMLLTEWLTGFVDDAESDAGNVSSLVIAGNSLAREQKAEADTAPQSRSASTPQTPAPANSYPTSALDEFLADLASSMHVHLLPGNNDPTSISLPQQPLHFALLPRSSIFNSLHRETNPAWFGSNAKRFLGTSGQNVDDIFKYLYEPSPDARLEMACRSLDWGHICPTAPDTISCYPLNDRDPFLVEAAPDVYFIGNQDRFATRIHQDPNTGHRVRVVLVPRFSQSGEVVLVNSATLECKLVSIDVHELQDERDGD